MTNSAIDEPQLNAAEEAIIAENIGAIAPPKKASIKKLEAVSKMLSERFNIGEDFHVSTFEEKGSGCVLSFEDDKNFVVKIAVKDLPSLGIEVF